MVMFVLTTSTNLCVVFMMMMILWPEICAAYVVEEKLVIL